MIAGVEIENGSCTHVTLTTLLASENYLESMDYHTASHCLRVPRFSRFGTVPACDGQTDSHKDGRTHDGSIYRASMAPRGKNWQ